MVEQLRARESASVPESVILANNRVQIEVRFFGAFLKSLFIDGEEVIYTPRDDPGRGGNPILGPTPGPVIGESWERLYPNMPSHGTDRRVLWQVESVSETAVVLGRNIGPDEFLFAGRHEIRFELLSNGVRITKATTNYESKPREIGHGFHPYFATLDEEFVFDQKEAADKHPLEPKVPAILRPGLKVVSFTRGDSRFMIKSRPIPMSTAFWSDRPDVYEAIEPWAADLGIGDIIGPLETKEYVMEIRKIS